MRLLLKIKSALILLYLIPLLISGQLLTTIQDVKIDVLDNVGSCNSLLFRLLSINQISKNDGNYLCNTFKFKIQKIDTPLSELSCSIFGSALIECDIKSSITSAELLRRYFIGQNKPKVNDLYYLSSILVNLPLEIANVLGKDDITDDINELINDEVSKLKKIKDKLVDYDNISYLFGTISHLKRLGSKDNNHIKMLNSILKWEDQFKVDNILSFESYVLYFSLLTRAYFYLKRPTNFTDIPISIHQMIFSLSRADIKSIKNMSIVNEYMITRKLLSESGLYLSQGYTYNDSNLLCSFLLCNTKGEVLDGIELSILNNNYTNYIKINNIPNTCEYEIIPKDDNLDKKIKNEIIDKLNNNLFKIKISGKSVLSKEATIPILNVGSNYQFKKKLDLTEKKLFLGKGIQVKNTNDNNLVFEYNYNKVEMFKMTISLETNLNYLDNYAMFNFIGFIEIKALEPLTTIGTRTINLIPAIVNKNSFTFFIDLTKDKLVCSSNEFSVRFILNNMVQKDEVDINNDTGFKTVIIINKNESSNLDKLCPFKIHPNVAKYYPKEEIKYKFKEKRKPPGPLFPYIFSFIILSFMLVLFKIWRNLLKSKRFEFNFSILNLLTMVSLIISVIIILCYWHFLNIFQFAYIFTPNIIIFFILLRFTLNKKYQRIKYMNIKQSKSD